MAAGYATPSDAKRLRKHPAVIAELSRLRAEAPQAAQDGQQQAAPPAAMPAHAPTLPVEQELAKLAELEKLSPLEYLLQVMRNPAVPATLRIMAAKTAAPFVHAKPGETAKPGKKEIQQDAAGQAGAGKFGPRQPPRLVSNGGT